MTSTLRAVARYWFLAILLLLFFVPQLGPTSSTASEPPSSEKVPSKQPRTLVRTFTPASSRTYSPTRTRTPTATGTVTLTPSPTRTPTKTATPTPSATPTRTRTPTPTFTPTFTPTPLPTSDGRLREARVPILMYHYISELPPGADIYRRDLSVPPAAFEAQLAWLRDQGYESITLTDLVYHLSLGWPLPDKPIILSFDDGYVDNYVHAFPLLKEYGYVGTFFLVTGPIDFDNPDYMTWDMVEEMHQAGMDFQPHSYRHFDLRGKDLDFLIFEILAPTEAIEAHTGETPRFFSYPSGRFDDQTVAVLKSANFWGAVITEQGATHASDTLFELSRVRVRGSHTLDDFEELITYDW